MRFIYSAVKTGIDRRETSSRRDITITDSRNLRQSRFSSENFLAASIPKKMAQQRQIAARMIPTGICNRRVCACPELSRNPSHSGKLP